MGYKLKKPVPVELISKELGLEYRASGDTVITNVAPFRGTSEGSLSFSKETSAPADSNITLIAYKSSECPSLLLSTNPRLDFIRTLYFLHEKVGFDLGYRGTVIHESAIIGDNVSIGEGVTIGRNTIIEPNVTILPGTIIGNNCHIRANASIGSDGFGYERLEDGTPLKFIHLGRVKIGDHVEIGSSTCIARGTLGDTIIGDYVKIDNLVHIAHNCQIKKGAFIIACAEVSGGVVVGENAWVAPNAAINHKVQIGENAIIGLGAVVVKNVNADTTVAGNPARLLHKKTK